MCCSQANCQTSSQLSDCMGLEGFHISLFVFKGIHSGSCFNPLLKLRFVYFSHHLLIIRSIYFFIHYIQCLCRDIIAPAQTARSVLHVSLPLNRLQCCFVCAVARGAYVSEWLLRLWFTHVCECVCAYTCLSDTALLSAPGGTSLP